MCEVKGFQTSYSVELNEHDETFFGHDFDSTDSSEIEYSLLCHVLTR